MKLDLDRFRNGLVAVRIKTLIEAEQFVNWLCKEQLVRFDNSAKKYIEAWGLFKDHTYYIVDRGLKFGDLNKKVPTNLIDWEDVETLEYDTDSYESKYKGPYEWTREIKRQMFITQEAIDDIMCAALEGGINYWCKKAEPEGDYLGEYASEQISRGGVLILYDREEDKKYELDIEKLLAGIEKVVNESMAVGDILFDDDAKLDACNIDANYADEIVQTALFGEIIFC